MTQTTHQKLVLVLTKDLGDTVLAAPAIREIVSYAKQKNYQMATVGGGLSKKAAGMFSGVELPNDFDPQQEAAAVALNFNFHQPNADHNLHPDTPVVRIENFKLAEPGDQNYEGIMVADHHMVIKFEEVLAKAGLAGIPSRLPPPTAPEELLTAEAVVAAQQKFELPEKYCLLMPGCAPSRPYKRWSPESFAEMADLMAKDGVTPVLIGGPVPDEIAICEEISKLSKSGVIDLCGKTSLEEICTLSYGSEAVIANDTGPAHMAAASKAETFALFSEHSHYNTWGIVSSGHDNAHTIISDGDMEAITPQMVYDDIQAVKAHKERTSEPVEMSR